jgi:glycyl-tRNA synthetase beta chain
MKKTANKLKVKASIAGAGVSAKKHGELLFEIGCEEIPAGMIQKAAGELKALLHTKLVEHGLLDAASAAESIQAFGAPRRLVAIVRGVLLRQEDVTKEVTGPPKAVAFDASGAPTRAAVSFAEKQGVTIDKLLVVPTAKGEYLAAKTTVIGRPAGTILEEILPQAIAGISWPKSMYWTGANGPRFIRPVRWIVALLDGKVVPFTFAHVASGAHTEGHRFLGRKHIAVIGVSDYELKLKKNFVLARPEARQRKIAGEIHEVTRKHKVQLHDDAGLQNLVVYLNEYPSVIVGSFDKKYLRLPDEILITVMRDHQKYFGLESKDGELVPQFLAVINLPNDPKGLVRAGHERVLRARFADAEFFWDTDQKSRLADYLPKLNAVTYESRLGSYGAKVERMRSLARWLAEQWFSSGDAHSDVAASDRAAELAKCDLVTDMVKEFTELQGIVGGLYAHAQNEPEEVAWAVYDHYKPVGIDDPIPRNLTGCCVALADKLDSIVACFAVGAIPTGSSDPFALRRAALGIVKIILERKLTMSLGSAIGAAAKGLREHAPHIEVGPEVQKQVLDFLLERARFVLREKSGFAADEINAVFAASADDLVDAADRIAAVKRIRTTKDFAPLAAAFKRIRNILEKNAGGAHAARSHVQPELLKEPAERTLFESYSEIGRDAASHKRARKYQQALEDISGMRPSVDGFFDKVMVMAEDQALRANRLALLGSIYKEFSTIADFSEIASEETR